MTDIRHRCCDGVLVRFGEPTLEGLTLLRTCLHEEARDEPEPAGGDGDVLTRLPDLPLAGSAAVSR